MPARKFINRLSDKGKGAVKVDHFFFQPGLRFITAGKHHLLSANLMPSVGMRCHACFGLVYVTHGGAIKNLGTVAICALQQCVGKQEGIYLGTLF